MIGILLHHFLFNHWLGFLLSFTFDALFSDIHKFLLITRLLPFI